MSNFSGIGVSPGVAAGPVRKIVAVKHDQPIAATPRQIFDALQQVGHDLEQRATLQGELEKIR